MQHFSKSQRLHAGLVAGVLTISLAGPLAASEPVSAVATIGMIGDVAENVGGECVSVTTLMGSGVDPHLYRATAGDVATLQKAEVIFYAGHSLEGQLGEVLDRLAERKPTLAVAEAAVPREALITVAGDYGVDPHLWMDPGLWAGGVPVIAEAMSDLAPDCAETIAAKAEIYAEQLVALDAWVRESVASVPEGQRILVTAHDAFGYYARAYGLEVVGIQGVSTEAEAGVADIRATAELVASRGVPALFVESTINPRTVQAVIDAAAERGQSVRIGGELYSDAMGEAGTAAGTYIGMIHANTLAIVEALGGTPAPLPDELAPWAETWLAFED